MELSLRRALLTAYHARLESTAQAASSHSLVFATRATSAPVVSLLLLRQVHSLPLTTQTVVQALAPSDIIAQLAQVIQSHAQLALTKIRSASTSASHALCTNTVAGRVYRVQKAPARLATSALEEPSTPSQMTT